MTRDQHRRVLIVDDDAMVRGILSAALRQRSLDIDTASDGREAIDLLRENHYAVVLLDLLMPDVNGFGVLDAIDHTRPGAPIVLVVSGAPRSTLDELDSQKIHGIIRKPVDPNEIAAVVAACSEIRSRSALETMAIAVISGALILAWLAGK